MNIAFVGCGFVFDIYMRTIRAHEQLTVRGLFDINSDRLDQASKHYGFKAYKSYDELLEDDEIDAIVNLTNIGSHFEVSKRALENGKHVYSEKPLTKSLEETKELFELQKKTGNRLYGAPCNIYSDTCRTLFKAVNDGAIGKPLLVYAELDDNPIHLMEFEKVRSPSGAPWPIVEEIHEGCTYEHVGYHLVWICALLGPAVSITAYSDELIENKTPSLPGKVGTPDYSVACLKFANGSTARITCSVVAPRDHRMRIIGSEGELQADGYRQYQSPVYLEKYTKGSLTARKFRTLSFHQALGRLFGIGGRSIKLTRHWKSEATMKDQQYKPSLKQKLFEWLRRREVYAQDKLLGIAEMAKEIKSEQDQYLTPEFITHINELTLLIQGAGPDGIAQKPTTSFEKFDGLPGDLPPQTSYKDAARPKLLEKLLMR